MQAHELLLPLYRGAREVPADLFIDWALDLLRTIVPFDMGRWGIGIRQPDGFVFPVNHLYRDDPGIAAHYDAIRNQDTGALWCSTHRLHTGNFCARTWYDRPDQAGIRAYATRFRHEHALITADIDRPTGVGRTISLYGAMPARPFAEHERAAIETLFPHLMEAWSINQALHAEKLRNADGARSCTVAVTDPSGFLHFVEPAALALLNDEWPGMSAYRLPDAAIAALAACGATTRINGARIVIAPVPTGRLLFLKIRARTPIDNLTKREQSVASRIARGLTYKEIAKELALSPATVRNQIQSIHERLNVRNNAELIAQIMTSHANWTAAGVEAAARRR
ncbi:helix-turn-helix transcriptional regulator [Paraburkholderia caballeronis]|uniref:Regulatory protein, luxR family n=1 Tax=Paraburkholderia caballeronis TaxID=416943 RepID=A0A1H7S8E0_9BURK|nr:helix-turn-helix transcriptional regulator [Paraburkholderia caballeronis]PXW22929.1 LuxR family transcriptional regulator [Paraburkholderia caballeronis]PXW97314.1 LuxR family transcriptional regulator [Paraburkholderia caballeronis]RAJ93834.1 LuxR family transcriptional regulator [Paraburkholderia caballeronis]SED56206.1 transcriptional regulator, LuxR family [Paraburkholderia caballeronis]SEL68496.1 regulatory protein, luxR family [Paraburkholderia caballeronis]